MATSPLIVVIGDIFVDRLVFHQDFRTTPDGVTVLPSKSTRREPTKQLVNIGGAGAVALMASALGARVVLGGRGDDLCQRLILRDQWNPDGEKVRWSFVGDHRCVGRKTRHIADGKTVFRIDREEVYPLSENDCMHMLYGLAEAGVPDALILSDYAKGTLTAKTIPMIREAFPYVPTFVDPHSHWANWSVYGGKLAAICPNRHEMGDRVPREEREFLRCEALIRKNDSEGLSLWEGDKLPHGWRSTVSGDSDQAIDRVVDTVGAGDMVIAALAVARARGKSWRDACEFANAAAGEKCTHWGAVPVPLEAVERRMRRCQTV